MVHGPCHGEPYKSYLFSIVQVYSLCAFLCMERYRGQLSRTLCPCLRSEDKAGTKEQIGLSVLFCLLQTTVFKTIAFHYLPFPHCQETKRQRNTVSKQIQKISWLRSPMQSHLCQSREDKVFYSKLHNGKLESQLESESNFTFELCVNLKSC